MGQAFDRDGNVLGEAEGNTKKEVFDKLSAQFQNAHEIRIKSTSDGPKDGTVIVKPSIGRIVVYNHPGSADGKYPPTQSPAIIQAVAPDGTVRLFVFGPKGQHMDDGLTQGDGPCQWNWPPRV